MVIREISPEEQENEDEKTINEADSSRQRWKSWNTKRIEENKDEAVKRQEKNVN